MALHHVTMLKVFRSGFYEFAIFQREISLRTSFGELEITGII